MLLSGNDGGDLNLILKSCQNSAWSRNEMIAPSCRKAEPIIPSVRVGNESGTMKKLTGRSKILIVVEPTVVTVSSVIPAIFKTLRLSIFALLFRALIFITLGSAPVSIMKLVLPRSSGASISMVGTVPRGFKLICPILSLASSV